MVRVMTPRSTFQRGISMIEVLVTMVIIAFGLLGIAGLQARLQSSEMESYQRTQALILLDDMVNRMNANRETAVKYPENAPLDEPVGAGMDCPTTDETSTRVQKDVAEWCNALQGAAELANETKAGAMVGGRGCVESLGLGANNEQRYRVTVAWQGLTPVSAPAEAEACGKDLYDGATGSVCHDDLCRRVVSTVVFMANLK
jgi:type IV pilus assembly protein PilV